MDRVQGEIGDGKLGARAENVSSKGNFGFGLSLGLLFERVRGKLMGIDLAFFLHLLLGTMRAPKSGSSWTEDCHGFSLHHKIWKYRGSLPNLTGYLRDKSICLAMDIHHLTADIL